MRYCGVFSNACAAHIPLDRGASDLEKRKANARLPRLGTLDHEVVDGVTDLRVRAGIRVREMIGPAQDVKEQNGRVKPRGDCECVGAAAYMA